MVGSDFRDELPQLQGKTDEGLVEDLLRYIRNVRKLNHVLCAPYGDLGALLQEYIQTGCEIFGLSSFSLRDLITEIGQALPKPEGFTFSPPENDLVLNAERVKLEQVVMNLISNAIKHHDRNDGTLKVSLSEEDGLACIAIIDDGPGIDPKYQEQVFKVFERLSKDKKDSTGIGLAVVNKLVEDAGGHVTLNSATGEGCTFTVYWPIG